MPLFARLLQLAWVSLAWLLLARRKAPRRGMGADAVNEACVTLAGICDCNEVRIHPGHHISERQLGRVSLTFVPSYARGFWR